MDEKNSTLHREMVEESNLYSDMTESPLETIDNYHGLDFKPFFIYLVC